MKAVRSVKELAEVINSMTYGDLLDVGCSFRDMCEDKSVRQLRTHHDFADMLSDWAEAEINNG